MTSQPWYCAKLQELGLDECLALLKAQRVGRIAFSDDSGPNVLPVNYVMNGEDVLLTTTGYGPIARATTGARVAFEIDGIDDFTESGWSVVVRGHATRESPFDVPAERPQSWADGTRTYVIRISGDVITGRRLIPS